MVQSSEGRLGNDAANGLNCTRYRRVLAQRYVRVSETKCFAFLGETVWNKRRRFM
jgi:hypothetical protein